MCRSCAVKLFPRRQRRLLAAIEQDLCRDDPRLARILKTFERVTAGRQMPAHERVAARPHWSRVAELVLYWLAAPWEPMAGGPAGSGNAGSQDRRADGGRDLGRHGE
jgi:hypothetical protein